MTAQSPGVVFKQRMLAGAPLVGSFVKTPCPQSIELLAIAGMDFAVIDAEHAPFDRGDIDTAVLAARASGLAVLVRPRSSADILSVLDCGADGILAPHVASASAARSAVAATRYRGGRRGYSGAVRAAGFGASSMADYLPRADAAVVLVAQIEDAEALTELDAIAAVDGVDALFIGRGDLTVSLGQSSGSAPEVRTAVEQIARAGRAAGKPIWAFAADLNAEAAWLKSLGASAFIIGSDQSLLLGAARRVASEFAGAATQG